MEILEFDSPVKGPKAELNSYLTFIRSLLDLLLQIRSIYLVALFYIKTQSNIGWTIRHHQTDRDNVNARITKQLFGAIYSRGYL